MAVNLAVEHFSACPDYRMLSVIESRSSKECHWGMDDFIDVMKHPNCGCNLLMNHQYAYKNGRWKSGIVGYVVYEKHKKRFDILNLVVDDDFTRKGGGTLLLSKMKKKLSKHRTLLTFDLRESNLDAQLWLRKNKFKATGVARDYFVDYHHETIEREDAFTFEYRKEFEDEAYDFGVCGHVDGHTNVGPRADNYIDGPRRCAG